MTKVTVAQIAKSGQLLDRYEVIESPSTIKSNNRKYPKVGTRLSWQQYKEDYPGVTLTLDSSTYIDWKTGKRNKFP
ncbi:MAG: hypothetical protein IPM39_25010 [Chloroflexi bacterium]|nr:hypothetical protein [Chloroflexota bacterium]